MSLSVSNQFQKKQVIESSKVNTNFNEIVDYVNTLETNVNTGGGIADGAITEPKLASNSVTNAKLTDDCVTSVELRDDISIDANRAVTTNHIRDLAVTTAKIDASAVTEAKIATSVAGSGLTGGGGSALAVNVDNSTIEVNADVVRLKDGGTTEAKLATAVQNKLGQNTGTILAFASASTAYVDLVNISSQGRLVGVLNPESTNGTVRITIDGTTFDEALLTGGAASNYYHLVIGENVSSATDLFAAAQGGPWGVLDIRFRTSLRVEGKFVSGTNTFAVLYERSA